MSLPVRIRRPVAVLLACTTSACYSYRPDTTPVTAGSHVRIDLRADAADSLASDIGPGVAVVEGPVVSAEGGRIVVRGEHIVRRSGIEDYARATDVHVTRSLASAVTVRRFDLKRSLLVTGGVIAATLLVVPKGNTGGEGGRGVQNPGQQ